MTEKPKHALREYHLLVARADAGFVWEIRYDRHAKPVARSKQVFATRIETDQDGQKALADLKARLADQP